VIRGAEAVAGQALAFSRSQRLLPLVRPVFVNGAPGFVSRTPDGRPLSVVGITVAGGMIVEIDILADPSRLAKLDLAEIKEG
jgi:RNA polymerase sigma-70 factor (ECF subfamily)